LASRLTKSLSFDEWLKNILAAFFIL